MLSKKSELKGKKGVIFDFDFTLANSSKGVIKCVNYALNELGFKTISDNEISKTIGLTLERTFTQLVGKQSFDKTKKFKSLFIKKADKVMADLTVLYSKTPKVIKILYNNSLKLGIVSTKFRYRMMAILSRENLLDYFDVIIGGEDVSTLKPDPSGLLLATKKLNLLHSEVIYIGDSTIDAEAANRADISFIAVLSGVTTRKMFSSYRVQEFLSNLYELPKLLRIE
ncbi:MAG: HAD family hydrolase [Promethearchaeota archaeon]